jgi:hypothetical protein
MLNNKQEPAQKNDGEPDTDPPQTASSYTPARESEPHMTATQYQNQQEFYFRQVERFKKMFEDSTLAKFIIAAGISGVVVAAVEVLRAFIDLVVYFRK